MSTLWMKIGAFGLIFSVLVTLGLSFQHSYNQALKDKMTAMHNLELEQGNNMRMKQALDEQAKEAANAQAREAQLNSLLKAKTDEAADAQRAADTFNRKLGDLKKLKPEVRAWADTPIPADVLVLLYNGPSGQGTGGGDEVGTNPGPTMDGSSHTSH